MRKEWLMSLAALVSCVLSLSSANARSLEIGQTFAEGFEADPTGGLPSQADSPHSFKHADTLWRIHNTPAYLWDTNTAHTGNASVRLGNVPGHAIGDHHLALRFREF